MSGFRLLVITVALGAAGYYLWTGRVVYREPGEIAPNAPQQLPVRNPAPVTFNEFTITQLATFDGSARVLAVKRYRGNQKAELAPVDIVVGWGPMSDSTLLDYVKIKQRNRSYELNYEDVPVSEEVLRTHSANIHVIPSSDEIRKRLFELRRGHLVTLSGYLVHARAPKGSEWNSSLTRADWGKNAGELFFAESLIVH